jgi:hypothetical protein
MEHFTSPLERQKNGWKNIKKTLLTPEATSSHGTVSAVPWTMANAV